MPTPIPYMEAMLIMEPSRLAFSERFAASCEMTHADRRLVFLYRLEHLAVQRVHLLTANQSHMGYAFIHRYIDTVFHVNRSSFCPLENY